MQNTKVWYSGEELTLWKISDFQNEQQNQDPSLSNQISPQKYANSYIQFMYNHNELRQKLEKLI